MSIVLRDFLTFPFNGGKGIRAAQIADVDVPALQAESNQRTPIYIAGTVAEDQAANRLTGTIAGKTDRPRFLSIAFFGTPSGLSRDDDALMLDVNGEVHPLLNRTYHTVRSRDLTPGGLYQALFGINPANSNRSWVLIDPLIRRPQDWTFVYGSVPFDLGPPLVLMSQAQADALTAQTDSSDFELPDYDTSAELFYFGILAAGDVPPPSRLVSLPGGNRTLADFRRADTLNGWVDRTYMGAAMTWYYISSRSEPLPHTYRVLYDYDNY